MVYGNTVGRGMSLFETLGDIAKTPVFFQKGETPGFLAAENAGAMNFYLPQFTLT
jgi:hypothetical protein